MHFLLSPENFTDEVAAVWGEALGLPGAATYEQAMADILECGLHGFHIADYFHPETGKPYGPCRLGLVVKDNGLVQACADAKHSETATVGLSYKVENRKLNGALWQVLLEPASRASRDAEWHTVSTSTDFRSLPPVEIAVRVRSHFETGR